MEAAPGGAAADSPRPCWELADIFRLHGDRHRQEYKLPAAHLKVMHAVEVCRTAALGGHLERCDGCALERPAFNSCRNRHCPKCGGRAARQWVEKRRKELLPVGYFHLVFTVPHELNPLILVNKKVLLNILFKAVSETLKDFGRTHLGGQVGFLAVLHTWDQTLLDHFHLHCLVPGGALAFDGSRWIPSRSNFLFHVKALSLVFRGKFLAFLPAALTKGHLQFPGRTADLAPRAAFEDLLRTLRGKNWVVYAKRPFSSPETVLEYLGRYTHRTAISNRRIVSVENGEVSFLHRDRRNGNTQRTMTVRAGEFIRRFLLHVLPAGFQRIRQFGFLANRAKFKKQTLVFCRQLLRPVNEAVMPVPIPVPESPSCPRCHSGRMIVCRILQPPRMDSS